MRTNKVEQSLYMDNLPEIPSEFIEPYFIRFISMEIEGIALGYTKPSEAKKKLKVIEDFAMRFCGIHAQYATMNEIRKFKSIPNKKLIQICKEAVNAHSKKLQK